MINRRQFIMGSSLISANLAAPQVGLATNHILQKSHRFVTPNITDVSFVMRSDPQAAILSNGYSKRFQDALTSGAPEIRAMVETPKAAQKTVRWAIANNMPFALRSGGHCFMGFSQHEQLVIDVTGINHIDIDASAHTVTVGSGVRIYNLATALAEQKGKNGAEHGFVLAHGTYGGVGMAGQTLGGGFGHRSRQDGLLCDQLNWVEMITASGDLVRASADENADLFWACCGGGGGQFGLVTQMQFRIKKAERKHVISSIIPMDGLRAAEAVLVWQFLMADAPRHTSLHTVVTKRGDGALLQLKGFAGGPLDDVERLLKDILRQTTPLDQGTVLSGSEANMSIETLNQDHVMQSELLTHSHLFNAPTKPDLLGEFMDAILQNPVLAAVPNFECWGGAMADRASDETAFVHRKAQFVVHVQSSIWNNDQRNPFTQGSEQVRNILNKGASGGTYVNYPDLSLTNWAESYWGSNLPRLKQIKQKWDPENKFDHAHSLARA